MYKQSQRMLSEHDMEIRPKRIISINHINAHIQPDFYSFSFSLSPRGEPVLESAKPAKNGQNRESMVNFDDQWKC